jgi:PHD/YefM family antitoxin component YafN of YafNO toxin-antitoxin module
MNAITIDNAISNFPQIVTNTIRNYEETVIVGEQGAVVLISQQEWNSIMETVRLFRDKKSLKSLLDGHSARRKGLKAKGETLNKAFHDQQVLQS